MSAEEVCQDALVLMMKASTTEHTLSELPLTDDRWDAICRRDASADGAFLYAVQTTGVFCKPSCPSRQAKRAHVVCFASAQAALEADFRACARCRPTGPSAAERDAARVAALCAHIDACLDDDRPSPTLAELAEVAGLSATYLQKMFKRVMGISPHAYARARRAEHARQALDTQPSVTAAIYEAGFSSSGRFYAQADEALGMTPTAWRAGGAGEEIWHAIDPCALGLVIVAMTARGVCAVLLGDDPQALREDLQARFPHARHLPADAGHAARVAQVIALIDAPTPEAHAALPLDLRGTAFQRRVWQALTRVAPGETTTYSQLAAAIEAPRAARAVAGACAANPIAVAVPCHRVVRADGSLSGYRWGVERKRALLAREAAEADGD